MDFRCALDSSSVSNSLQKRIIFLIKEDTILIYIYCELNIVTFKYTQLFLIG